MQLILPWESTVEIVEQSAFCPGRSSKLVNKAWADMASLGSVGLKNVNKLYYHPMYQVMFLHMVDVMKRPVSDPAVFNLLHVEQSEVAGINLKATNPSDR